MISCQKFLHRTKLNILFISSILILILSGCSGNSKAANNSAEQASTGYPSGELQMEQVFYNNSLYYYMATGVEENVPDNLEYIGNIAEVDKQTVPTEDFYAGGHELVKGQKIYIVPNDDSKIYIEYEDGYRHFEKR